MIDASRGVPFDGYNCLSHSCDRHYYPSFERAHGGRASPSKTVILSNQLPQVIHIDMPLSGNQAGGRYVEIQYISTLLSPDHLRTAALPRAACGNIGTSGAFLSCHPHTDIYAGFRLRIRGEQPNIALLQQPLGQIKYTRSSLAIAIAISYEHKLAYNFIC